MDNSDELRENSLEADKTAGRARNAGALRSPRERPQAISVCDPFAEGAGERLCGGSAVPANAEGLRGVAQVGAPFTDAFGVGGMQAFNAGAEARVGFGFEEVVVAGAGEFHLDGIENLESKDIVAARATIGEFGEDEVFVVEEV